MRYKYPSNSITAIMFGNGPRNVPVQVFRSLCRVLGEFLQVYYTGRADRQHSRLVETLNGGDSLSLIGDDLGIPKSGHVVVC